jgi:hypothetical protein
MNSDSTTTQRNTRSRVRASGIPLEPVARNQSRAAVDKVPHIQQQQQSVLSPPKKNNQQVDLREQAVNAVAMLSFVFFAWLVLSICLKDNQLAQFNKKSLEGVEVESVTAVVVAMSVDPIDSQLYKCLMMYNAPTVLTLHSDYGGPITVCNEHLLRKFNQISSDFEIKATSACEADYNYRCAVKQATELDFVEADTAEWRTLKSSVMDSPWRNPYGVAIDKNPGVFYCLNYVLARYFTPSDNVFTQPLLPNSNASQQPLEIDHVYIVETSGGARFAMFKQQPAITHITAELSNCNSAAIEEFSAALRLMNSADVKLSLDTLYEHLIQKANTIASYGCNSLECQLAFYQWPDCVLKIGELFDAYQIAIPRI